MDLEEDSNKQNKNIFEDATDCIVWWAFFLRWTPCFFSSTHVTVPEYKSKTLFLGFKVVTMTCAHKCFVTSVAIHGYEYPHNSRLRLRFKMTSDGANCSKYNARINTLTLRYPGTKCDYIACDYIAPERVLYQGHPTTSFGKISVRKTISDLEFSEHLL